MRFANIFLQMSPAETRNARRIRAVRQCKRRVRWHCTVSQQHWIERDCLKKYGKLIACTTLSFTSALGPLDGAD